MEYEVFKKIINFFFEILRYIMYFFQLQVFEDNTDNLAKYSCLRFRTN